MALVAPKLRFLSRRPLCIICARPTEAVVISKHLGTGKNRIAGDQVEGINNGYTFYYGSFTLESKEELAYYVTSTLEQGIQSFTVQASIIFSVLRPQYVIHAGVCTGYNDPTGKLNLQISDVILGEAATNYEEGKLEYVNEELLLRPHYRRVIYPVGDLAAFVNAPSRPNYHYGEYISGSLVRKDASLLFEKIRMHINQHTIALDMESSTFLQLCQFFEGDQVVSLGVIKGVIDLGVPAKGSVGNTYHDALRNTAKALEEWVRHRFRAIPWVVDESDEIGASIVPAYYENFTRKVIDNMLQGWPVTDRYTPSIIIPRDEIKGLKTVLPKGNDPSFFQERQHVAKLVERHHISEVTLGGANNRRSLYYKAGYLIDWAQNMTSLKSYEDGEYQVGVFGRLLSRRQYYMDADDDGPARASVVSWEDIIEWLKDIDKEESRLHLEEETERHSIIQEVDAQNVGVTSILIPRKESLLAEPSSHVERGRGLIESGERRASTSLEEKGRESPTRFEDTDSGGESSNLLQIPQYLRDIVSAHDVKVEDGENQSFSNQLKALVEDYTMSDWNWWPLERRMKALQADQSRLIWYCSCGTRLWMEISKTEAALISSMPKVPKSELSEQSECFQRSKLSTIWLQLARNIVYSVSNLMKPRQQTTRGTVVSSATSGTTSQTTSTGQAKKSAPANSPSKRVPSPTQSPGLSPTTNQPQSSASTAGSQSSPRWILFGVQGSRPFIDLEHIKIDDYVNDSSLYRSIIEHYRKHRGKWKLLFSIWRLSFCDGVKFDRVAPNYIVGDDVDLPTDLIEYEYAPGPPNARNPLISQHHASIFLNCDSPCRWRLFHECVPDLISRKTIDRVPIKRTRFDVGNINSPESEAWGLKAKHEVSAAHVALYHLLILALPFAFWGWWQATHPADLQNASVPVTVVLGMLSLFWGTNGILTHGRHARERSA
ncbi:hypothetical protein FB567DRAFT_632698 [Paraphoma chrysanthemicola]|uniref:Nucleoside phosphorylase domain-containing protein n=1 Tax=Paraphoma chrysanthemicola TaxID=798071 RepID=A0A8K0VTF1_9PLEO|nr:hypothetical protein FB567DRAFT_632698 [Paraphoma chrysanthemicola]